MRLTVFIWIMFGLMVFKSDLRAQTDSVGADATMMPNPFREQITIRLPENGKVFLVQVINNYGQLVYSEKLQGGRSTIVTQNWAPGHYLVKVNNMVAQKMILLDR